jgi:hypothetical protein
MERILFFKFVVVGGGKDHGLKSLEPLGDKFKESLAKALEDCHLFASSKTRSN